MPERFRIDHRLLRAGKVLLTLLIAAAAIGLLLVVAPPDGITDQLGTLNLWWVGAAIVSEVVSCLWYPLVFRRFFPEPPRAVCQRVAWISMGAGAVLPGGNISSAAATGLLLRRHGIGAARLIGRCAALLALLILFGFFVNGLTGIWLLVGLPGGPHDFARAAGPLLVSIGVLGTAAGLMRLGRRLGTRSPTVLIHTCAGLEGAWEAARRPSRRLAGAAGFLLFDIGALEAACLATGHQIGVPAMALAYFIGYLATLLPVPAGIGVLDSGLAGMLAIYGMNRPAAAAAVLVYHAISIWVPGLGGLIAWLPLRRPGDHDLDHELHGMEDGLPTDSADLGPTVQFSPLPPLA